VLGAEGRDLGIMKSCEILSTSEKLRKNMLHFLEVIPRIYRIFDLSVPVVLQTTRTSRSCTARRAIRKCECDSECGFLGSVSLTVTPL
jgi:hypothetical protein